MKRIFLDTGFTRTDTVLFGHEDSKTQSLRQDYKGLHFSRLGGLVKFCLQSELCRKSLPSFTGSFFNAPFVKPALKFFLGRNFFHHEGREERRDFWDRITGFFYRGLRGLTRI